MMSTEEASGASRGETEREQQKRVREVMDHADGDTVAQLLADVSPEEIPHFIDRFPQDERARLFELLSAEQAAATFRRLSDVQCRQILTKLPPDSAAGILNRLDSDERADLLSGLRGSQRNRVLEALDTDKAAEALRLIAYPEGTAGSLMYSEFLAFNDGQTVQQILDDLIRRRDEYAAYEVQYAYVLDAQQQLCGVLPIRNLLFADKRAKASQIMIRKPVTLLATSTLAEMEALTERFSFLGFPVVDDEGRLLGIVDRERVREARQDAATGDFLKMQGLLGKEELRSMPLMLRTRRRFTWLSINIGMNLLAASVIALHQDTLASVIALAVFLPIISDMGGCTGNQAVAVTMRELTLGVLRPGEVWRVVSKEFMVGLLNGLALGAILGGLAWLWQGNPWMGLVVGGALALNTVLAVLLGGLIPLAMKKLGQDPALAAGPILTSVTDLCGFLLVLTFASQILHLLE